MLKYIIILILFSIFANNLLSQDKSKITSLSLKDAIEIAVKNHPEVQKSKYYIEAAKGRHLRDISLPPLNLSVTNEFIPNGSGITNYDESTIEISQGFDFPTIYFAKNSRADAEINAAGFGNEQTLNNLRTSVKRAYFTALAKYQLLKVAEENNKIATEFQKKAEIRYKVGEGTNLELLTSKVQLTESKSLIETSKMEYLTALEELKYFLGNNTDSDLSGLILSDSLFYRKYDFTLDGLVNNSMQMNPNIKRASSELESAEINRKIAWMNLIPSFNASYMFQKTQVNSGYYGVRLGISLPVWFMYDQRGSIMEADANYSINTYELQNIKNLIIQKIHSAYLDYLNHDKQLILYQNELIPQTEEIFRTADLSYQAGEITYLEFLQAKITTINTRINLIKYLFDYKDAIITLEESTGITIE